MGARPFEGLAPVVHRMQRGAPLVDLHEAQRLVDEDQLRPRLVQRPEQPAPVLEMAVIRHRHGERQRTRHHDRRGGEIAGAGQRAAAVDQVIADRLAWLGPALRPDVAALPDADAGAARDDGQLRARRLGGGELPFQLFRRPGIVVVQEGDPLAQRRPHPGVARPRGTERRRVLHDAQAAVLHRLQRGDGGGVRPVHHHHDFQILDRLGAHALHGRQDQMRAVARRDDRADGDGRGFRRNVLHRLYSRYWKPIRP